MNKKFLKLLYEEGQTFQIEKDNFLLGLKKELIDLELSAGRLLKNSKQAINSAVSGNIADAKSKLNDAELFIKRFDKNILNLKKEINRNIEKSLIHLKDLSQIRLDQLEENFKKAEEEYLEAKILFIFLTKGTIYEASGINLKEFDTYVGGMADFCGELVRKARSESMISGFSNINIERYKKTTMEIYEDLIEYSFSNSSGNRGKIEQLKGYIDAFDRILCDFNSKEVMKNAEDHNRIN